MSLGISKPVSFWLGTNIIPDDSKKGCYRWQFDKEIVTEAFKSFRELDMWSFLENYNGVLVFSINCILTTLGILKCM